MKLKFEFECANFILADWESVKFCSWLSAVANLCPFVDTATQLFETINIDGHLYLNLVLIKHKYTVTGKYMQKLKYFVFSFSLISI